jgi:hypothetical protein
MAAGDNKKLVAELKALREKLNLALHRKEYAMAAETCLEIIALDKRAKTLNIMVCLYHKDLGEIYWKLLEYENAVAELNIAREGLIEFRATKKLKFPDDWLNELKAIDRLIERITRTHLT